MALFHVDQEQLIGRRPTLFEWLKNRKLALRLCIGAFFVFSLTLFLHFQEVRFDFLELDTPSDRYVTAQIDFQLLDEDATALLRQESIQDVGFIYKIQEEALRARALAARDYLVKNDEWRKKIVKTSSEELYQGVELIKESLLKLLFTDERTEQMGKKANFELAHVHLIPSVSPIDSMTLDSAIWAEVKNSVIETLVMEEGAVDFLIRLFGDGSWKLQEDRKTKNSLLHSIQSEVQPVYSIVKAGTHLVDLGEKVTPRHLEIMQAMKQSMMRSRDLWQPFPMMGSFLLALIFTSLSVVFLRIRHLDLIRSPQKLTLLVVIVVFTLILAKGTEFFLIRQETNWMEYVSYPLFVPLASLLLSVLLGTQVALFISCFLAIILGVSLSFDHDRFLVVNLIAALLTIIFAKRIHKRKEIFTVSMQVWLATLPVLAAYHLSQHTLFCWEFAANVATTCGFMMAIALFVVGFLPLFESRFHVLTDMSLMEYMDPNNELLRRLSTEAPGTYQHSLVVGNLAEAAAQTIHANSIFCRVSSLYHDIGKLFNPHYFTENQLGGLDLHQLLTPCESAQVIISHVAEGEALARKHHLPQGFIDIIRQHHGSSLVYFFYCKQAQLAEKTQAKIVESKFRYSGEKPRSKESAIIMIADCVEAASRSLSEYTEQTISLLVSRIIKEKIEDGQLDEAQLTFAELAAIKKSLIKSLLVTHHLRVKYPTQEALLSLRPIQNS